MCRLTPNPGITGLIPAIIPFFFFRSIFFSFFVFWCYNDVKNFRYMITTPIYQELYLVYESLKTKVDQNSMVTSREIDNGMFMFELCFIQVISN